MQTAQERRINVTKLIKFAEKCVLNKVNAKVQTRFVTQIEGYVLMVKDVYFKLTLS